MRGTEGHSIEALRAYAREIEATVDAAAPVRVGSSHQDEALSPSARKGAAPLLPLAVVSFALVGAVALAATVGSSRTAISESTAPSSIATTTATIQKQATPNAERAVLLLASRGLTDTATVIEDLISSGMADEPSVAAAIEALRAVVETRSSLTARTLAFDPAVIAAIGLLEAATRPPGLDPDRIPPGQGGTPPGQDETFTPPGQDETFTPPGQDETFTPPGQGTTDPGSDKGSRGPNNGRGDR